MHPDEYAHMEFMKPHLEECGHDEQEDIYWELVYHTDPPEGWGLMKITDADDYSKLSRKGEDSA